MKIFFIVLLVAYFSYGENADRTVCPDGEHAKLWQRFGAVGIKACDEGTCYNPEHLPCDDCNCYTEDGVDCEIKCVCNGGNLRQPNGTCRDPSDCPAGSPGLGYALEERK
uniref:Putative til domain protein n=1 Tax=Ixodes ricinus TaxID=34613 RepID=A0A0K8R6E5_IXORI